MAFGNWQLPMPAIPMLQPRPHPLLTVQKWRSLDRTFQSTSRQRDTTKFCLFLMLGLSQLQPWTSESRNAWTPFDAISFTCFFRWNIDVFTVWTRFFFLCLNEIMIILLYDALATTHVGLFRHAQDFGISQITCDYDLNFWTAWSFAGSKQWHNIEQWYIST